MKYPAVGFGVLILNNKKILLGCRNSDPVKADSQLHGEGQWTCPGGKLHFGEKLIHGVEREVKEETNLTVKSAILISVTDNILKDVHYVTVGFVCKKFSGIVKTMEPDEIIKWKWFDMNKIPKQLFKPARQLIDNYQSNKIY